MAEQRITFPDDHPYYPGKSLVIPEDATQEQVDEVINSLSKPPSTSAETALGYAKTFGSALPKAATNLIGGSVAGAATLGGLDSPSAARYGAHQAPPSWLPDFMVGGAEGRKNAEEKAAEWNKAHPDAMPAAPNPAWLTNRATKTLGLHEPQTPGEKIADVATQGTVGAFLGGAPAGSSAPVAATLYGALPSAAGEYVRQKTEGIKVPQSVPLIGGKDVSPAASALAAMFSPIPVRAGITRNTLNNPVRWKQYETAVNESGKKFKPTAGQLLQDQAQINSELASKSDINRQQSGAIMETVTGHAGEPVTDITAGAPGEWVDRNLTRTGKNIDNLEQTTHIQPVGNSILPSGNTAYAVPSVVDVATKRPQDVPGILKTISDTSSRLIPHPTAMPGEEIHSALFNSIGTRKLTGEEYRRLRSNLHSAAESAAIPPEQAHSYRQVANALDAEMQKTNPDWGNAWDKARREYAHTLVGQKLAAKGAGQGQTRFSPKEIASATKAVMGEIPFVRGALENSPFVSAAGAFPPLKAKKLPETPSLPMRVAAYIPGARTAINYGMPIGAALGGLAAHQLGMSGEAAITTGILGGMLGEGTKRAMNMPPSPYLSAMNPAVQWYKKNQIAPLPEKADRRSAALIRALFNNAVQNKQ